MVSFIGMCLLPVGCRGEGSLISCAQIVVHCVWVKGSSCLGNRPEGSLCFGGWFCWIYACAHLGHSSSFVALEGSKARKQESNGH